MEPLVTVVIPCRDRPKLLRRAIQSVLEQTIDDLEIVVVDDGSTVDLGLAGYHPGLRVVRNAIAVGAQRSRLIGSEIARGRYVALLDSDDWWRKDKIEKQLEFAKRNSKMFVSSRVMVANGSLRRIAPWRPLSPGERVEDFLYVKRGMLQSSTVLAEKGVLVSLLTQSAGYNVHNDTMLFLEAQRQELDIVQLPEPLSFFDDNPRADRISYDQSRVTASLNWFNQVSGDWSSEARKGFILMDMVTRYVNTGQRFKAFACLLRGFHPKLSPKLFVRQVAYVVFNGSPMRFLRRPEKVPVPKTLT